MIETGPFPILEDSDSVALVKEYSEKLDVALRALKDAQAITVAAPTYQNGWAAFGGGYEDVTFSKVGRRVTVFGMMKPGTTTTGTVAFLIPNGMAPAKNVNQNIGTAAASVYAVSSLVQFGADGTAKLFTLPSGTSYVMFNHSYLTAS